MPVIDLGSVVGPQGQQGVPGLTGAQGIQGNPGPNQVTDQTSTNLNGVLFGSQSRVAVKPVDSTPTEDSTNLVSSGGVKSALDVKANQVDLTNIQATGSTNTTGATITAGTYFYLNGALVYAKVDIASGATFTSGTNYDTASGGSLNKIRSTDIPDVIDSRFGYLRCISKANNTNSGATLTFDLNGNGVGLMFAQAAGTDGAIYGLTVLDSVTATRLAGSYSPTINGANPRSFSISVGPWASVTIICTRSGWAA